MPRGGRVGARSLGPGAGSLGPGAWGREPGAWGLGPGAWGREPGAGSLGPGAGKPYLSIGHTLFMQHIHISLNFFVTIYETILYQIT